MQYDSVLAFTFILQLVWFLNSNSDDRCNHMTQRHPLPCRWVNHYPRLGLSEEKREIIVLLYSQVIFNNFIPQNFRGFW